LLAASLAVSFNDRASGNRLKYLMDKAMGGPLFKPTSTSTFIPNSPPLFQPFKPCNRMTSVHDLSVN